MDGTSNPEHNKHSPAIQPELPGLEIVRQRLQVGEEINWSGAPTPKLMLLDLVYRAIWWWLAFAYMLPFADQNVIALTVLLMILLAYMEYRKSKLGSVYALTGQRAIFGKFQQNGELKITEFPLRNLVSFKKSPFTRTVTMKFREGFGSKMLKFPYIAEPLPAMEALEQAKAANS